jgi:hypothetical protein
MIIKNVIKVDKYVSQTSHFRSIFQKESNSKRANNFIDRYLASEVGQWVDTFSINVKTPKTKLRGLSPRGNYIDESAKLVPTFANRRCHVVSMKDLYF